MYKILFCKTKPVFENKFREIQLNLDFSPSPEIDCRIDFTKAYGNVFTIVFDFFNLLKFSCWKDKENDHAGLNIHVQLICFHFMYSILDTRHWDYDNNKWEEREN